MIWQMDGKWLKGMIWTANHSLDPITRDTEDMVAIGAAGQNVADYVNSSVIVRSVGQSGLTDDTELTGIIPAGYAIDKVYMIETAGNSVQLSCGLTSGGGEVFSTEAVGASSVARVIPSVPGNILTATTLYLHDDGGSWNSAEIDIYFIIHRITVV